MQRIGSPAALEELRKSIVAGKDPERPALAVCAAPSCHAFAKGRLVAAVEAELAKRGLADKVELRKTGCLQFCEQGPVVIVFPQQVCYLGVTAEDVPELVEKAFVEKAVLDRLLFTDPATGAKCVHKGDIPFFKDQTGLLIGNNALLDPKSLDDYLALGGYGALSKALFQMKPE
ncbi:MAG: NADH-quinone oxidoreductase subunit F, partial [Deltaproteobacteria bacterium]|nr:NADH-quinone oxidoreductase subunit F [Deltaproteobacteria bacterium]